ncbi:hypothetical protein [Hyalangium rubrum]|uniref:SPOR domain-containing protein n=1 Tax=Hyalangium rubrum TaxID=3103134 RepID=A0ABU5GZ42_9BACT|nr:hypothetical protein [Hyalangium sp. s54d21]MDY7226331.1 hypothetical protein [Hyalangium sp. s54d21]
MDSRLSLLALVALAGCGSVKGCGGAAPASSASAPSPAPSKPASPEARFAQQYLVIVHSSPTPGEGEPVLEKLRAAGLGSEARRLSTTPFASLRPCLEVVVAGAFADRDAALALAQRLDGAGIDNYLKNAGALAKDRERREADCREQAQAREALAQAPAGSVGPRFLDVRGKRTFVLLTHEPQDTPGAELRPVGEDRGFWFASLKEDPTGTFKQGEAFDLYDAQGPIQVSCRVKGFGSLNRGIPHFGYFQQPEPPADPGCGNAWPVAELDCSLLGTRAMDDPSLAFVLPKGSPAPRYFTRSEALPEPVKAAQEEALRGVPAFAKARAEGEAHAQQQGTPLRQELELRSYSASGRQVVVGLARFHTGEGMTECGGPDYAATVSRVVALGSDGRETPVGGIVNGEDIVAVLDVEGDGQVELLTRTQEFTSRVALVREDGAPLAASFLPNCDCGC